MTDFTKKLAFLIFYSRSCCRFLHLRTEGRGINKSPRAEKRLAELFCELSNRES